MSKQKEDHGRSNALAGYDSIREMVAALDIDYDRLEELREKRDELREDVRDAEKALNDAREEGMEGEIVLARQSLEECKTAAAMNYKDDGEELEQLESAAGECESREDAEQRIHEDALSVEVRSDWYTPGQLNDASAPSEFKILLTTGGPALQMRGELNEHGEPSRARLEYQDWGTPWTQLVCDSEGNVVSQGVLLAYARCFYFGEG